MEPNFQTSFIPKKPMIEEHFSAPRSIGLFTIISILIFFTVLLASGGLYFYKGLMKRNISTMENSLNSAKERFEPAKIVQLQVLDKRLNASNEILSKHIAISPIFKILQSITMKTVQYTNFSYTLGAEQDFKILVKMKGLAVGYRVVALQSDLFTENEYLIDPVFSNLELDDKGNVLFDLEFSVDPNLVNYKQMLEAESISPSPITDEIPEAENEIPN